MPDGPTADGMRGFVIGNIRIDDPESYKGYAAEVPDVVAAFGGTFLARGGKCEAVEGGMELDRMVIVGFSDVAAAKKFHSSEHCCPVN